MILPGEDPGLARHLARRTRAGYDQNVNPLGEAVLGEDEAHHRLATVLATIRRPDVDYVSVKITAIYSQVDALAFDHTVDVLSDRLRTLYRGRAGGRPADVRQPGHGGVRRPPPHGRRLPAGARRGGVRRPRCRDRHPGLHPRLHGGHGRSPAPGPASATPDRGGRSRCASSRGPTWPWSGWRPSYGAGRRHPRRTKAEVDARYKHLLDLALDPDLDGGRAGRASPATTSSTWPGPSSWPRRWRPRPVSTSRCSRAWPRPRPRRVRRRAGRLLLYAPVVAHDDFEAAIAYLVRRLDENAAPENFLHDLFALDVGSPEWERPTRPLRGGGRRTPHPGRPAPRGTRTARSRCRRATRTRRSSTSPTPTSPAPSTGRGSPSTWVIGSRPMDGSQPPGRRPVDAGGGRSDESRSGRGRPGVGRPSPNPSDATCCTGSPTCWPPAGARPSPSWPATRARRSPRATPRCPRPSTSPAGTRNGGKLVSGLEADGLAFAPAPGHGRRLAVELPPGHPGRRRAGRPRRRHRASSSSRRRRPRPSGRFLADCLEEAGVPDGPVRLPPVPRERGRPSSHHPPRASTPSSSPAPGTRPSSSSSGTRRAVSTPRRAARTRWSITATADLDAAIADLVRSAFGHAGQKCSAASLAIVEASVYDGPPLPPPAGRRRPQPAGRPRRGPGDHVSARSSARRRARWPGPSRGLDDGEAWLVAPRACRRHGSRLAARRAHGRPGRVLVPPHRVLRAGARRDAGGRPRARPSRVQNAVRLRPHRRASTASIRPR